MRSKNKVLILGASGMAGHVIYHYLKKNEDFELMGTVNLNSLPGEYFKLDIFNLSDLSCLIEDFKPNYVIDCIGILISGSTNDPSNAIYANSFFPHRLAKLADLYQFKLVHISTDCVFSGKVGGYNENSLKDADDIYGRSKALGEINDESNLTIRTSIIGPEIKPVGEGLFHWFMLQQGKINGYKSNFWSGVTTLELARFVAFAIKEETSGLINLTNGIPISKFRLLQIFNEIFEKNLIISDDKDYKCDKSLVSNLDISFNVQNYEKMIKDQRKFMYEHREFYPHYKLIDG